MRPGRNCLNPYSNGTMYLIRKYDNEKKALEVLILILMEQCI